jgi:RNA 2',3'-cyclic 3'-phosphodiesterase
VASDRASEAEAPSVRLFLGVEIPENAKRAIAAAIEPLCAALPRVRWLPAENWHVTVKFLGPTPPRLVPWVEETVGQVAAGHAAARVSLDGIGAFPSTGRARVVWAGVEDPMGALAQLAAGLDAALAAEFRVDMRAFTPHITVARPEPPIRLAEATGEAATLSTEPFSIDRLVLFRSHLRRPAPRYEPLSAFPLGR